MSEVFMLKAQRTRYDKSESLVIKLPETLEKAGINGMISKGNVLNLSGK